MAATAEVVATARIPGTSKAVTGSAPAQERTGTSGNAGNIRTPELVETPVETTTALSSEKCLQFIFESTVYEINQY